MRFVFALLAPLCVACAPCHHDTDCGSAGLCFRGQCTDFSGDHVPCSCMMASDCRISGLQCVGGQCVTDLDTPVMCGP
jgi:hypothetical protein